MPTSLIEKFVSAKAPRDPRDKMPLEDVNLDADREATSLVSDHWPSRRHVAEILSPESINGAGAAESTGVPRFMGTC